MAEIKRENSLGQFPVLLSYFNAVENRSFSAVLQQFCLHISAYNRLEGPISSGTKENEDSRGFREPKAASVQNRGYKLSFSKIMPKGFLRHSNMESGGFATSGASPSDVDEGGLYGQPEKHNMLNPLGCISTPVGSTGSLLHNDPATKKRKFANTGTSLSQHTHDTLRSIDHMISKEFDIDQIQLTRIAENFFLFIFKSRSFPSSTDFLSEESWDKLLYRLEFLHSVDCENFVQFLRLNPNFLDCTGNDVCKPEQSEPSNSSANSPASLTPGMLANRQSNKTSAETNHLDDMDSSVVQNYFRYYGKLSNQMNMLQDTARTSVYRKAVVENPSDFDDKIVMDVGAGSGILSFFSLQAGARKVYAVEASSMADVIVELIEGNSYSFGKVEILKGQIEGLAADEQFCNLKVDSIISEPMGTFLFNERMIESFLFARDCFLKPGGKMYPNRGFLAVAPFMDISLYYEIVARTRFWRQTNFYGVNLSKAYERSLDEQFMQPIVDCIDPSTLVSPPHLEFYDFQTVERESLENIFFEFTFPILKPCLVHGLAGWFDVEFYGTDNSIRFSTSPWAPLTHWYQIRFPLKQPLAVNAGQVLKGSLKMTANDQQSYNIDMKLQVMGTPHYAESLNIDLKDPDYRYYTYPTQASPVVQQDPGYFPNVGVEFHNFNTSLASNVGASESASRETVLEPAIIGNEEIFQRKN